MDKSFSALYREIEEEDLLEEAWPKVELSKPHDQHEYDFLVKIGRRLDKVIRMLPDSVKKEVVSVHHEVESRAVILRLADDRGWGAALQIVGSNDKMIENYKDRISEIGQAVYYSLPYARGYSSKFHKYQHKSKRASLSSSDSEREYYERSKEKRKECHPFEVGIFMDPWIDKKQLPAITAKALGTSSFVTHA